MSESAAQSGGPQGGLQLQANVVRRWRWGPAGELLSAPVRCKREQWYLARGFPTDGLAQGDVELVLNFVHTDQTVSEQRVSLSAVAGAKRGEALLGWVQAPEEATHLQVRLPDAADARRFDRLLLHPIADRDPKCHPLANVPRWSSYRPAFPLERVVLPESLEVLAGQLKGVEIEVIASPRSLRKLAAKAIGAACVVDGRWVRELGLGLSDIERVAGGSWMIIDLETFATLVGRASRAGGRVSRSHAVRTRTATYTSEHEIMSARVEYADVPTRGFALQDVFPYAALVGETAYRTRVLLASKAWKRYADQTGFATLLASETPWEDRCGDVLSAARPIGQGELIVTDLPWLVAGQHGRLLAPRLAEHLLRMHLGGPLADYVQYWNHWDDCRVMVRDIGDLPRRYPPLRAVRWVSRERGVARLGVSVPANAATDKRRHLMICTGRIDSRAVDEGVPPEPLVIFMKWLAREAREHTRWAARFLYGTTVTWQFDTAVGLKYALHYDSAVTVATDAPTGTLILGTAGRSPRDPIARASGGSTQVLVLPACTGVLGDGSLGYQADLTVRLRRWIERGRD